MFGRHREPSPGLDAADRILLAVTQIEELTQEVRELVAEMKADEPDNA
jgi:hypothetical protein